jgi:hypothetical protein
METFFAFALVLILGFAAGYAVREFISRRRKLRSRRARSVILPGNSMHAAGGRFSEPIESVAERGKAAARLHRVS